MRLINRFILALTISAVLSGWTHGSGAGTPVVSSQTIVLSVPLANNGAVGTASATNSPTSWTLVSSTCATCYQISNSGVITGAANAANVVTENDTLVVTATNSNGTSAQQPITVAAYVDGFVGAPAGVSAQNPTMLNGETLRSPWKVAGVDYGVGPPAATSFKNPNTIGGTIPGIAVSGSAITCSGANVVLDSYDFTLSPGYFINGASGCSNLTVSNCKVGPGGAITMSGASSGTLTVNNCNFDDTGNTTLTSFIGNAGGGSTTIKYNYFLHANQHIVEAESSGAQSAYVFQFNYIENSGTGNAAAHVNYSQFGGSPINNLSISFNGVFQQPQNAGGEGFQIVNCCGASMTFNSPDVSYNTMVTTHSGSTCALSYLFHIANQTGGGATTINTGTMTSNYVDDSGTLDGGPCGGHAVGAGFLYAGTAPGMTLLGNKAMQNGASIP